MQTRVRALAAAALGGLLALGSALALASGARAEAAIAVSAGSTHSCAVTASGAVHCWGLNRSGLGNKRRWSDVPVRLGTLGNHGAAVAAGIDHSCVLTDAGGVKCWGQNYSGQLGDGTTVQRYTPVPVVGLASGVVAIDVGVSHSCALTAAGAVRCWGSNAYNALGVGSATVSSTTPITVPALASGVVALAIGGYHNCAATAAGQVWCWGLDDAGQTGVWEPDGVTYPPVSVAGLSGPAVGVAAGASRSCALISGGSVECWGYTSGTPSPAQVPGLSDVIAIDAGGAHMCAVTSTGGLLCWGSNFYGQIGDGTTTGRTTPVSLALTGVSAVSAGFAHTCAISGGEVTCWGHNLYGQLGNGEGAWSGGKPVAVTGLPDPVTRIGLGEIHTCALDSAGVVRCWGHNGEGQLGNHSNDGSPVPVRVSLLHLPSATSLTSYFRSNCALTPSSQPKCWGRGSNYPTFVNPPLVTATALGVGRDHRCGVAPGGIVYCWGYNGVGQLGDGNSATNAAYPVLVAGGYTQATGVAGGREHTCAVYQGGNVRCWGANNLGQLGNGTTTNSTVPVLVTGLSAPAVRVTTGERYSCALTSVGGVECWGAQLGNNPVSSSVPVPVTGLSSGIVDLAAGEWHSCAARADGAVLCWGDNYYGQIDGTLEQKSTPVLIDGLPDAVSVGAGGQHSCAVTSAGAMYCWGQAEWGQLGDGTPPFVPTPVAVAEFEVPVVPAIGWLGWIGLIALLAASVGQSARGPTPSSSDARRSRR